MTVDERQSWKSRNKKFLCVGREFGFDDAGIWYVFRFEMEGLKSWGRGKEEVGDEAIVVILGEPPTTTMPIDRNDYYYCTLVLS